MDNCVICGAKPDTETAAVLEMSAYGTPKYICGSCASDLDIATSSKEPEEILQATARIAKKAGDYDVSGRTFVSIEAILASASERAQAIKDGSYDFSEDEPDSDGSFDEIPEELQETEEDRELDRKEEEQTEKVNKMLDYISIGAVAGIAIFVIWKILDAFLF